MYKAKKGKGENEFRRKKEDPPTKFLLFPRSFGAYPISLGFGILKKTSIPFIMSRAEMTRLETCTKLAGFGLL
ncbi:hypothetical protein L484_018838 [Morus notabilis]|uniref:Uncharacterized protein n=1 Tax=Morus notabilis TaxID=981085 RepID=W9RPG6_9ROSA|nr:hypothetical protein L484_018838 [Morus notabilis]